MLANVFDRLATTGKRLGDPPIRPIRTIGVRFQQDLGTLHFLARPFEFLRDLL
jgi:hypothetical protein